jgi:hypothetical protein
MFKRLLAITAASLVAASCFAADTAPKKRKPTFTEAQQQARLFHFKPARVKALNAGLPDNEFLLSIASDTWRYFKDVTDKHTGLPLDNVIILSTYAKVNSYTTTTNIGLYLMCLVSGYDLGFITKDEAVHRVTLALNSVEKFDTWEGQYFNYYGTIMLDHSGKYVSTVDNGWLAAGLTVAKEAFPEELSAQCGKILGQLKFAKLYDPKEKQFFLGYDADKKTFGTYHYGVFCTEPRVTSYLAIARGEVPEEHWFRLFRALPREWTWQQQKPEGVTRTYAGVDVFEGYYEYHQFKFVPSWGGSMFEYLMPTLVLKEKELAAKGLGLNDKIIVDAQIYFALEIQKYPVWGLSPCSTPGDIWGYGEFGVAFLGAKGYGDKGVVTPHATFLALEFAPEQALKNLRKLLEFKGMYGEYGFYDAVNAKTGQVSPKFLCLDQAMTLIALNNYLNKGAIRERFHKNINNKNIEHLLSDEKFF